MVESGKKILKAGFYGPIGSGGQSGTWMLVTSAPSPKSHADVLLLFPFGRRHPRKPKVRSPLEAYTVTRGASCRALHTLCVSFFLLLPYSLFRAGPSGPIESGGHVYKRIESRKVMRVIFTSMSLAVGAGGTREH